MADSLLAALEELNEQELRASEYASDAVLVIDNDLRTIAVPSNFIFGVYNDKNVLSVNFEMPRTYDDVDLSGFTIQINYLAPNKVGNVYEVTDPVVGEDKITFEWLLDRGVFLSSGTVEFTVCLREIGQEGAIIREFNTTIAKGTVLAGLEIEDPEDPEAYSLLAHIKQMDERVTSQAGVVASDYAKTARIADDVEAIAEELADDVAEVKEKYGTPLVAPTAADMTDHTKIYVYTGSETGYTFGNWYYWDGTAWTSGGVYNSAGVNTDSTLSVSGMPADAKKTGDEISGLKEDLTQIEESMFDEASETGTTIIIQDGVLQSTLTGQSGTAVRHTGKNVLPFPYFYTSSTTINGITYTPNSDGTIHVQGTATDTSTYYIINQNTTLRKEVKPGTYVLSGCPAGGSGATYEMIMNGTGGNVIDHGDGVQFTVTENKMIYLRFIVYTGQTVDIILHPMIEYGNVKTEYEPYKGEIIEVSNTPRTVAMYGNTDIFAADADFTVNYFVPTITPTGIISIKDYGATGNGVTDDTTAIINALTAGAGKTVYIPKGIYLFSRTLHVKSGTKFVGAGAESILQVADNYTLDSYDWRPTDEDQLVHVRHAFIIIDRTENGVTLSDFKLRGQTEAFVDACLDGISVQGTNNIVQNIICNDINYFYEDFLHRVYSGVGRSINVIFANNCIIQNCVTERNGYEGIGVEESTNITVQNCYVGDSCQTGIQIHRVAKNIKILGNVVKYSPDKTNLSCTLHAKPDFDTYNIVIQSNCFETGLTVIQGGENNVQVIDNHFVRGGMTNNANVYRKNWIIRGNVFDSGGITMRIDNCIITDNMLTVNAGYQMINMRGNNVIAENNIPLGSVSGVYIEPHE